MNTIRSQFGVIIALLATINHMVSAENPDYKKTKAEMELRSSQSLEVQRDVLTRINNSSEKLAADGERVLGEFKSHVGRLIPYLSHPTSEPFMDSIQDYINSKTSDRQHIIKIISEARIYQKRAEKEVSDSEKRYNRLLEHLSKSVEPEKAINQARSHYKALSLAKDRLLEINDRMLKFEPLIKEKIERITLADKKLDVYRLLLEMVKRARGIVSESKNAYIDSFSTKDKILDGSNRMDSLVKRAKLFMGESKRKGLYRVEMEKVSSLWDELNQLKDQIVSIARNSNKTLEHMYYTVTKAEGYEKTIIEEGSASNQSGSSGSTNSVARGVHSISKGFIRGKEIYNKLASLQKTTTEDLGNMEQYKKQTLELLKKGNDLVNEMEGISKRKSAMARKTLNLSTPQDLRSLVDLNDVASDNSDTSSESESEEDEIDTAGTKTKSEDRLESDSDVTKRTKKRKTRKELDELRNKAIGSYLDDLELLEASSGSGSSGISSGDSSYDSDSSTGSSGSTKKSSSGKDKKKKKGLIKRGFKFLKKIATYPETFEDPVDRHGLDSSSDGEFFDAQERFEDTQPDSDFGGNSDAETRKHTPAPRTRGQNVMRSPPSYEQTQNSQPPSYKQVISVDSAKDSFQNGDAVTDLTPEEEEDYKKAVRESVIMDLQRKTKEEMETERRFNFADTSAKAQQDLFRLVRLSYELKEQFELVKEEFKSSFQFNAAEILKNTLRDLLHQYLSSVCSVALDMTRPRYYQLFSSNGSGKIFGVGGINKSRVVSSRGEPDSQTGDSRPSSWPADMQGNTIINGRVAPKRTYSEDESESETYHGSGTGQPRGSSVDTAASAPSPPEIKVAASPASRPGESNATTNVPASHPTAPQGASQQATTNTVSPAGNPVQPQVQNQIPTNVQPQQVGKMAETLQQVQTPASDRTAPFQTLVTGGSTPESASPIDTRRRVYKKMKGGDRVVYRTKPYNKAPERKQVRPESNMRFRPVTNSAQFVQPTQLISQPEQSPRRPLVQQAYTQTPVSPQYIDGSQLSTRM